MKTGKKTIQIVLVGVFAARSGRALADFDPAALGHSVTLQTFAVALCGYALGWKRGLLATAVYVALGLVGAAGLFRLFRRRRLGARYGRRLYLGLSADGGALRRRAEGEAPPCGAAVRRAGACRVPPVRHGAVCGRFGHGAARIVLVASAPYLVKDAVSVAAAYGIAAALQHALRKNGLDLAA